MLKDNVMSQMIFSTGLRNIIGRNSENGERNYFKSFSPERPYFGIIRVNDYYYGSDRFGNFLKIDPKTGGVSSMLNLGTEFQGHTNKDGIWSVERGLNENTIFSLATWFSSRNDGKKSRKIIKINLDLKQTCHNRARHNPANPHPTPNIALPTTNLLSVKMLSGK